MTTHFDDSVLLRYLREELSPDEQSAIDAHLEICADRRCARALERLARSPAASLPAPLKTTPEVPEPEGPLPELPERYELLGRVGHGGMGLVVRVRDRILNRELAVKTLREKLSEDDPRLQRFREEAHITAQMQHPGVPPVHDLGELPDGRPFFAMKLVKGETLAARLKARSSPAEGLGEFLRVFEQICETLAYAHNHDIIHRDLKPANIMIGAHGEVQVMDWGLAKKLRRGAAGTTTTTTTGEEVRTVIDPPLRGDGQQTKGALGTYAYMAPEQARGRVRLQDERSDVFSLGAVLCKILTGEPPYVGEGQTQVREQAEDVSLEPAYQRLNECGAPAELVTLAKRCLAEERDDRPRNAGDVWQAVKAYREGEQERRRQAELLAAEERARAEKAEELARVERARAVAERRARRRALVTVAVGLLLVGSIAGGWWWLTERKAADEQAVELALAEWEAKRGQAFAAPVVKLEGLFRQAQAAAERAVKLAQGGVVPAALQRRAGEALAAAEEDVKHMGKDRELLARLMDVAHPREISLYQQDEDGRMVALTQLSVDEQFAQAFQRWGLDINSVPVEQSVARLKCRPNSVVQEVVAALDEWALQRRRAGRGAADWRQLYELATRLDASAPRRQIRRLMIATSLQPSLATLAQWVQARAKLRDHVHRVNPATEPVLELISLTHVLERFGDAQSAEALLRAALAAHPDEVVLLMDLGRLMDRQRPRRNGEAIECYRAARALRPDLGVALSELLSESKRAAEAETICRDLVQRLPGNPEPHLYLGNVLRNQKKLEEAEAAYRKAIELRPDFPYAYNNLSIALLRQKKLGAAMATCRKAIELRPGLPEAYANLANVLSAQQRLDEAVVALQKAIRLRPNFPGAYYNLGITLRKQKKLDKAVAAYRKAVELKPDYADAYINLSAALLDQRKMAEAVAACRKAIEFRPEYPETYINLGVALVAEQKLEEAVVAYRKAIQLRPNYPEAYTNLGNALREQKKPEEAEAACRKAIELQPDFPEAYTNLGAALRQQKKLDEAVAAYRKAIQLRPDSHQAYANLGGTLRDQEHLNEAEAACRQAIQLQPNYPEAHNTLGIVLAAQKRLEEAVATYRKAIELRPDYPEAYSNLGAALCKQKKLDAAVVACRKAIELRPDYPEAYTNLGAALADQKKLEEGVAAFRRAIELQPNYSNAYYSLGIALSHQNKLEEAVAAYCKAIQLRPRYPDAHNALGNALAAQQKLAEAGAAYREAIQLRPNYPEAYTNLGNALRKQQKLAEAEAAYRKAAQLRPNLPEAHNNLGIALRDQKKLGEAVQALRKADRLLPNHPVIRANLKRTERLLEIDGKVPAFLEGSMQLKTPADQIEFAEFCHAYKDRHLTAVGLYAEAFRTEPKLLGDLNRQNRFHAASAAALALAGKGVDVPTLFPEECCWLSTQARSWLRGDLGHYTADAQDRRYARAIVDRLKGWKRAETLTSVRDPKSLAGFPEDERREWLRLWADVDALLQRLDPQAGGGR
jgi:tetratricopeptide (TPR) repeat protein